MQNRVTVTVKGKNYTLLAVEDESYVKRVAAYVDNKLTETGSGVLDHLDCAVLTALNIADERFKNTPTYKRLEHKFFDCHLKLESNDVGLYAKSVALAITAISNLYLKHYYDKRNIVVANHYFNLMEQ